MTIDLQEARNTQNIELLAKQMVEGFITGLHKSPYHGFSVEFAEHRQYNNGESIRHIDWKVFAKTDKLFVKRYEEETNLRANIIIDNSSSMYYPLKNNGKITFSIITAAALSYLLQKQRDAIGLSTFSDEIEIQTPVKSTSTHVRKMLMLLQNMLQNKPRNKPTYAAKIINQIARKIHKRSLVIIFSDMFDQEEDPEAIFSALQHLKHNNHEIVIFHVMDHQTEMDFNFDERPHEFIDLESRQKIKLNPFEIRETYKKRMAEFYENLKITCGQSKIDFVEVDIHEGYEKVLFNYLVKRTKMQ